jgi:hypothetical protein
MYKKEGGTTHGMTFNCHMKSIDIWIETIIKKSVVFCSGYNAPNLYRIIQKICIYIYIYTDIWSIMPSFQHWGSAVYVETKFVNLWNSNSFRNHSIINKHMFTLARICMTFDQCKLILSLNSCTITKSQYYGKQYTEILRHRSAISSKTL